MSAADWNARFQAGKHTGSEPDRFLAVLDSYRSLLPSQVQALDVACGAGRHSIALAERGFETTAVDFSRVALDRVAQRAQGLTVTTRLVDLEAPDVSLGEDAYDLIAVFQYLHRPLFPALDRALRPGGLIVFKTYTVDQAGLPGGPSNPDFLLRPNELLERFQAYRVLRYEEEVDGRGTAALLAQKPGSNADRPRTDQPHRR